MYLEHVARADFTDLYKLCTQPQIYRYLFDGAPPDWSYLSERIEMALAGASRPGFGFWLLRHPDFPLAGAVDLADGEIPRSRTLTWLLHPALWGRGIAFRMAWTALLTAFEDPEIDLVIADADGDNRASRGLMERLGMSFRREVSFPLGPGVEYGFRRGDEGPDPAPALLEMRG
ncbi:GNAT family N-acetyltransferase [Nisaea sediminum]|uniref:GNAT family N-acetyltransferase n=1 Tax=Nisaea sediminum TaxID=2775867 RepID=UPI00186837DE|nr:GNAT family N-acetyltransferase [Nisaea sediminum]